MRYPVACLAMLLRIVRRAAAISAAPRKFAQFSQSPK